jgi:hypothetical protein
MPKLTVKDLLELKGVRQIAFVQVVREEEALAAAAAGIDMIGTGFRTEHDVSIEQDEFKRFLDAIAKTGKG